MKSTRLSRYGLSISAAALLAGCGASQPPVAPGAMVPSRTSATHAQRGGSWVAPDAKSSDLLYVTNAGSGSVTIYRLGPTRLVGTLTGFRLPVGVCSDSGGNVYVVDDYDERIYEYAHGGTEPIKTLFDVYGSPGLCAYDRTAGNLAVTDYHAGVLIYKGASGDPTDYYNSRFQGGFFFPAYDDRGNLFVDGLGQGGSQFAILAKGSSNLTSVTLNATVASAEGVAWDGKYFAICDQGPQPNTVDDFSISGSSGTLERTMTLNDSKNLLGITIRHVKGAEQIIGADAYNGDGYVWDWNYPGGGAPIKTITKKLDVPSAVAISRAPH